MRAGGMVVVVSYFQQGYKEDTYLLFSDQTGRKREGEVKAKLNEMNSLDG